MTSDGVVDAELLRGERVNETQGRRLREKSRQPTLKMGLLSIKFSKCLLHETGHHRAPRYYSGGALTRSLPLPVLTRSKNDFGLLRPKHMALLRSSSRNNRDGPYVLPLDD